MFQAIYSDHSVFAFLKSVAFTLFESNAAILPQAPLTNLEWFVQAM